MEEEGWYLHNAMIHEGVIYHPDCFKDLQKNGGLDNSLDTTADSVMDTSSGVIKEEAQEEPDQEMKSEVPDVRPEQTEEIKTEAAAEPPATAEPSEMEVETPVSLKEEQSEPESVNTEAMEAMELTDEVKTELTDQTAEKLEESEKEENEEKEVKEEAEKELEEESSANTSLVGDESHMLAAPVMSQPKVVNLLEGGDWLCLPSQFSSIVMITKIYLSPRSSCNERLLYSPPHGPG